MSHILEDSDSEESLSLHCTTFRRSAKSESNARARAEEYLEQAINSCQQQTKIQREIYKLQCKQNIRNQEPLISATTENQLIEKNTSSAPAIAQKRFSDITDLSNSKPQALVEAEVTQQTVHWGGIFSVTASKTFYSSRSQLLYCLDELLRSQANLFPAKLHALLISHLRMDSLDFMLLRPVFRRRLLQQQLPRPFLFWLITVTACCSVPNTKPTSGCSIRAISRGAYRLLIDATRSTSQSFLLRLPDLQGQLVQLFGLPNWSGCLRIGAAGEQTTIKTVNEQSCVVFSLSKVMQIWDTLFERKAIAPPISPTEINVAMQILEALMVAGIDPMFSKRECHEVNARMFLQRNISHIIGSVEAGISHVNWIELPSKWATLLFQSIEKGIVALNSTATVHESNNSDIWLCWSKLIRSLLNSGNHECQKIERNELCITMCSRLLRKLFSLNKWDDSMHDTMIRWGAHCTCSSIVVEGLACSYLALLDLKANVSAQDDTPRHLAIVELCSICLHAALRSVRHYSLTADMLITSALCDIDSVCGEIAMKSSCRVFSNPELLRLNFYINCFRQFPRLESLKVKSHKKLLCGQPSLDSLFSDSS